MEVATASRERIPISALPPLPPRHPEYWMEPFCGICFVGGSCAFFVSMVRGLVLADNKASKGKENLGLQIADWGIMIEAGLAVFCVLYILFGQAGMIRRSRTTCYPMPPQVEATLREAALQRHAPDLTHLSNIYNEDRSVDRGSFCVRCLVWRPQRGAHHCSTCQRCVTYFDHHCGVFGRCIVGGNMCCFSLLIGLFPAAFVTMFVAMMFSSVPLDVTVS